MSTNLLSSVNPRISLRWLIATMLTFLVHATVYAEPPIQGGGNFFDLTVTPIGEDQVVGANTISLLMLTGNTDGTLNGTVSSEVTCVLETSTQKGNCHGTATFEGDVEGAEGTLLINDVFRVDGPNLEAGSFTILSGTDELINLKGEGSFSGSFDTASGTYTMAFHSHPNGEEASQAKILGAGCMLLRPVGWWGRSWGRTISCVERPTTTLPLADGQAYTAYAVPSGELFGEGYTTLRCSNGRLNTEAMVCRQSFGEPY